MLRLVSLAGVFVMLGLCYAFSVNRRAISWRTVGAGVLIQALVAMTFLYWDAGNQSLQWFGRKVDEFLGLSQAGTSFVFNALAHQADVAHAFGQNKGFLFATQVLPTLIFFSAFMSVLYHLGIMQLVVRGMAVVMARVMRTSGAESTSACANIFVGQTEAPLLVRPFLPGMTLSEIHAIMTGGFATIAGGVFVLYVGFGVDPGHLMVASVMGAPAGLVCSKLMFPETVVSETMGRVSVATERTASNVIEAAANGAIDGLKLALNVGAMLIAFLGLVAVVDYLLAIVPGADLSLVKILGWVFYPIAAVMGVERQDIPALAQLLGTKLTLTELVAYLNLTKLHEAQAISERTMLIASFALCGFANVGSIAIQIGGLSAMAPERKADLSRLALRAMCTGALATCMTASIAGVVSP